MAVTRNKRVGLIATAASVRSGAYERTIAGLDRDVTVISKACPLFVPLVENGRFRPGDTVIETVAREYLAPLRDTGIDTLIMGCTHYPAAGGGHRRRHGPRGDAGGFRRGGGRALKRELTQRELLADRGCGGMTLYASDRPEDFGAVAGMFLGRPLDSAVRPVNIEEY